MDKPTLDKLVLSNKIYRFQEEYINTDDPKRQIIIKNIVDKYKNLHSPISTVDRFNNLLNRIEEAHNKKAFYKLNMYQKEQLVKDYVKNNYASTSDKENKITSQIIKLIEDKKILSANVVYDIDNYKLNKIKNIAVNDGVVTLLIKKNVKNNQISDSESSDDDVKQTKKNIKKVNKIDKVDEKTKEKEDEKIIKKANEKANEKVTEKVNEKVTGKVDEKAKSKTVVKKKK